MAKKSLSELKALFITGKVPTQQDWIDVFDSFVHLDGQNAVDSAVVNTAISNYDGSLKAQTPNGHTDSLGDLFTVFNTFDDTKPVQPTNVLKYTGDLTRITGVLSPSTFDPNASGNPNPMTKWVAQDLLGVSYQDVVIRDIQIQRKYFNISGTTFYADIITSVKYGVNPQIKMQE